MTVHACGQALDTTPSKQLHGCARCAGKEDAAHRPPCAASWEYYCCAAHASADVQVASIMADKSQPPVAPAQAARVLRYCAALQTLDNPVLLAKRLQVHPPRTSTCCAPALQPLELWLTARYLTADPTVLPVTGRPVLCRGYSRGTFGRCKTVGWPVPVVSG